MCPTSLSESILWHLKPKQVHYNLIDLKCLEDRENKWQLNNLSNLHKNQHVDLWALHVLPLSRRSRHTVTSICLLLSEERWKHVDYSGNTENAERRMVCRVDWSVNQSTESHWTIFFFFLSKTAKTHTRNFFAFFSGGLDPDQDPYLPAAMLDSPPVCSVDPAATIFPGKSSLSGLLSKLTLPWRTKTK